MSKPMPFTAAERATIRTAFLAVEYVSQTTNWSDGPSLRAAYKAVRKDAECQTEAQWRIVKAWHAGATAIINKAPITDYPFGFAEHYQAAWRLGAQQARDRLDSDYTGPLVQTALDAAPSACEAGERAQRAWLDSKGYAA